jgi:hypothetical protein
LPCAFSNLAVACRGASFSHLAASSCRLSRTMMQLGQAVGTAVAVALARGAQLPDVPLDTVRERLRNAHSTLEP